jgi:hypothetical protein
VVALVPEDQPTTLVVVVVLAVCVNSRRSQLRLRPTQSLLVLAHLETHQKGLVPEGQPQVLSVNPQLVVVVAEPEHQLALEVPAAAAPTPALAIRE